MTGPADLGMQVRSVLRDAVECYRDSPQATRWLKRHLDRFSEPLRVAIAGRVKAGKSTLLNALVGEQIAPTDAGECTRVITWYQDSVTPRITLTAKSGARQHLPVVRVDGRLNIDLQGAQPEEIERMTIDWPSQGLRAATLIDTPGIASLSTETSARTTALLMAQDEPTPADAVVYLVRHLHSTDVRFLEAFHDRGVARATPVNTIAVLSRADEIGAGRIDAMISARRVARRYRSDAKVRELCQGVVAVAGLLAQTGRTLRQSEIAALTELAAVPRPDLEAMLLSVDRFTRATAPVAVAAELRMTLLERFGIFGIRLTTSLIQRGGPGAAASLAPELVRRSGFAELQETLAAQFTERADMLKARSALLAVERVLREEPRPGADRLARQVERIVAGAHEFREQRLLAELRSGAVTLPPAQLAEARRLLGEDGAAAALRLGLESGADPGDLRAAALESLGRWRRQAESPLSTRAVVDACRVVVRSCEGLLARLPA
ncbi:MAG TPA: dynamin family protein [Pseudonocardiaceae bacterium]